MTKQKGMAASSFVHSTLLVIRALSLAILKSFVPARNFRATVANHA